MIRRTGMRRGAAFLALVLAVAGCGPSGSGPSSTQPSASDPSSGAPSDDAPSASPSAAIGPGEFINPVLAINFPDPHVIEVDGAYYAYATTDGVANFQAARSTDLVSWEVLGDPMPNLPVWASGDSWAPEVVRTAAGFVMTFTARAWAREGPGGGAPQCQGVAFADDPAGPFVDPSDEPLVCQEELGGTIDGTFFRDADGALYLVYKNDGNCCGIDTRFFGRRMTDDALAFNGDEVDLGVRNDAAWEGPVIEAPTIVADGGRYYLLYSANHYGGADYAVGFAVADAPLGPYVDGDDNPILATVPPAIGPGHQAVVQAADGSLWLAYHAWNLDLTMREMWIDRLEFIDGRPMVHGPTAVPQPVP